MSAPNMSDAEYAVMGRFDAAKHAPESCVERVAIAMHEAVCDWPWDMSSGTDRAYHRIEARAAIDAVKAEPNADEPVGICGARLNYTSNYYGMHVLCVCTKTPGHVDTGDAEHEDGTRGGAPNAKWIYPEMTS